MTKVEILIEREGKREKEIDKGRKIERERRK